MTESSHSRQSRVVGCEPVPKAMPGSSVMLIAAGSGCACQDGTIHRRFDTGIGSNWAWVMRTQFCSSSGEVV